jgi:hypothetical protein
MHATAIKGLRILAPQWKEEEPVSVKKVMNTALEIIAFVGIFWGLTYLPCSTWYGITISYMITSTLYDAFSRDTIKKLDGPSKNILLINNVWFVFLLFNRFQRGTLLRTDSLSLASNVFILLTSYGVYEQFS